MKGAVRLGVLLTAIWLFGAIGVAGNEFRSRNVFCQFDEPAGPVDPLCHHYFWSWDSTRGDMRSFSPVVHRMLGVGVGVPAVGWLLGFGIIWVVRGFKQGTTT